MDTCNAPIRKHQHTKKDKCQQQQQQQHWRKKFIEFQNGLLWESNCKTTVAKRMSNLTAHDVITKWIPSSSHENLITSCSNWRITFVPFRFGFVKYIFFIRSVRRLDTFHSFSLIFITLGSKFTPIHGDNKRKLIPLTSLQQRQQPVRVKLKTVCQRDKNGRNRFDINQTIHRCENWHKNMLHPIDKW